MPQRIAPGGIYPALEGGTIEGVEYIGPYDDSTLGFDKVAKNDYFPGWGKGGAVFHAFMNALPGPTGRWSHGSEAPYPLGG